MDKPALLIVDDDSEIRSQMEWAFSDTHVVHLAGTPRDALAVMKRERPPLVTLDLGLPPRPAEATEGLALLDELLAVDRAAKVIVITGNNERANALAAIARGAYDFIEKPVQLDALKVILDRAAYLYNLEQEHQALQEITKVKAFHGILGASPPMQQLFDKLQRVGASDVPVLILGESGTGKELVARALHQQSSRRDGAFVVINCGAIPDALLESELFGHEKGSFTGAHRQQKGKLEYAHGGTLLLDEIGEMPLGLQVKLLRFLQDGRLERVGGREQIEVDTRVLAATNVDLKAAIGKGLFREDLFYRLSVVQIVIPPLRDRGDDVVVLAQAFTARYRDELPSSVGGLSEEAKAAIRAYAWPGNVRELENRIKRGVIMAEGPMIQPADLELPWEGGPVQPSAPVLLKDAKARIERDLVLQALSTQNWNVSRAAEELGVSRQSLRVLIQRYGLDKLDKLEKLDKP
jgi:two-component system NtrC family response regulator